MSFIKIMMLFATSACTQERLSK